MLISSIALTVVLLTVFFTDLKSRRIYLVQILALLLFSLIRFFQSDQDPGALLFKTGWLGAQLLLLFLYVKLIRKKEFFSGFGMGDLLFFAAILPLFGPTTFVMYYITGLLFSLLIAFVLPAPAQGNPVKIPLAGLLGIWMLPFLFCERHIESIASRVLTSFT